MHLSDVRATTGVGVAAEKGMRGISGAVHFKWPEPWNC